MIKYLRTKLLPEDAFTDAFDREIGPAYHRYLTGQHHPEARVPFFDAQRTDAWNRRNHPEWYAAHPVRSREYQK